VGRPLRRSYLGKAHRDIRTRELLSSIDLRAWRERAGIRTQAALAVALGYRTSSSIDRIESGERCIPINRFDRFLEILGNPPILRDEKPEPLPPKQANDSVTWFEYQIDLECIACGRFDTTVHVAQRIVYPVGNRRCAQCGGSIIAGDTRIVRRWSGPISFEGKD
jgi:hypothetical protein